MTQHLLQIRIRPARVTLLLSRSATQEQFMLGMEFLSKIWSGRFSQILPVDPGVCDESTRSLLAQSRPEFVYGIGLQDSAWSKAVQDACQPRGYLPLGPDVINGIRDAHPEGHFTTDHALIHLMETRNARPARHRRLRTVEADAHPWKLICAAMYGVHHPQLHTDYRDEAVVLSTNSATEFVRLSTEFVRDCQQSWWDVTGYQLSRITPGFGLALISPTIVLLRDWVPDLTLFWNLRVASDPDRPEWVLPVPAACVDEPELLGALKEWLLAFREYGLRSDHCFIQSASASESECREFARRLQAALTDSPIQFVDYEKVSRRLPLVVPYERETTWAVTIRGRTLTMLPPPLNSFGESGSRRSWVVDLMKDLQTGRAVKELQLPSNSVAFELLNGPCPPGFHHSALPQVGDGTAGINVICSGRREVIRIDLPTASEVLLETLREHGIEPVADEKRSSYLPVLRRFGGLKHAAAAFSGQSGTILESLMAGTRTPQEVISHCKLGNGALAGKSYVESLAFIFRRESERIQRISRDRFVKHARAYEPESLNLRSLLEYWAGRSILTREWKIGPCRRCRQQDYVPQLNLRKPVHCLQCGHRMTLPQAVPVGYALHRAVRHSMSEGIVPVTLTGRFLRNLTDSGFFWLPGVKYRSGSHAGDIDLLACCDGHLVFCECKRLGELPDDAPIWDAIVSQFLETVSVARRCGGALAVLAAQVTSFPQRVRDRIASEVRESLPCLLLDKHDLEEGTRQTEVNGHPRRLGLQDVLQVRVPHPPRAASVGVRTIRVGAATITKTVGIEAIADGQ